MPHANTTCTTVACLLAYSARIDQLNFLRGGRKADPSEYHEKSPQDRRISETAGHTWWMQEQFPQSYTIQKLDDASYPRSYFITIQGQTSPYYLPVALEMTGRVIGRPVSSVLELGNGGGYYAELLHSKGFDILTIEGTRSGYDATLQRGVPPERVKRHDLRLPLVLPRRFDIALLTEVVEHVEPPFSSQVILNAVLHADVIWFSFAGPHPYSVAQAFHPNERPAKNWTSLFDFYGFECVAIPQKFKRMAKRGDFIAFNRSNPELRHLTTEDLNQTSTKFPQWKFAWMKEDGSRLAAGTKLSKWAKP